MREHGVHLRELISGAIDLILLVYISSIFFHVLNIKVYSYHNVLIYVISYFIAIAMRILFFKLIDAIKNKN